jgi:hypothetical protein
MCCRMQAKGVLLTTPERRLSLLLKRQELWEQGDKELRCALDKLIDIPFIDLLDESDELLSHRLVQDQSRGQSCHGMQS